MLVDYAIDYRKKEYNINLIYLFRISAGMTKNLSLLQRYRCGAAWADIQHALVHIRLYTAVSVSGVMMGLF